MLGVINSPISVQCWLFMENKYTHRTFSKDTFLLKKNRYAHV